MSLFSQKGFARNHSRPLAMLARVREHLEALSLVFEAEGGGALSSSAAALISLVRRLEDRLDWGPEAPLIVAVLGATGTGKSKIFNSLIGRSLSPSGFKRPTTLAPVLYLDRRFRESAGRPGFFPGYDKREAAGGLIEFDPEHGRELIVVLADDPGPGPVILIDTPDFDSVLASNRDAARDVFDRSDAIIFVTDAVKYADQADWDYLERLRRLDKRAVLIVNRVKNPLSIEDFSRRLGRAGLERPLLGLADQPDLGDADLFDAREPVLEDLGDRLADWVGSQREEILAGGAAADWLELRAGLKEGLLPGLDQAAAEVEALKEGLRSAAGQARDELARELTVSISAELKDSLIDQIQTLFLRWDLLRYPRRLLSLPVVFIKEKVLAPLGVMEGSTGGQGRLDREINRFFEANRERLVSIFHQYNRRAADLFDAGLVGPGLAADPRFEDLAFPAERVRELYGRVRTDLEAWIKGQAEEMVRGLNLGEKMTFYLAQAVSLGLFISVQVQTGGGFSFLDGLLDGVLAPIMSKITGAALSRDKVRAFEDQAARLHLDLCQALIDDQTGAYLNHLTESEKGLAASAPLARAADELDRAFDSLK